MAVVALCPVMLVLTCMVCNSSAKNPARPPRGSSGMMKPGCAYSVLIVDRSMRENISFFIVELFMTGCWMLVVLTIKLMDIYSSLWLLGPLKGNVMDIRELIYSL